MRPEDISDSSFVTYPPEARQFAREYLPLLRQLPLVLAILMLREVIQYDWRFPAEKSALESQFRWLQSLTIEDRSGVLAGFAGISLSRKIEAFPWAGRPQQASERMTADLWSTHQIDAFHAAATNYGGAWSRAVSAAAPAAPRLCIAILGPGLKAAPDYPLFRKLRPHGTFFPQVDPANGVHAVLDKLSSRAAARPSPYEHWYIEGGAAEMAGAPATSSEAPVARVSWNELTSLRAAILHRMQTVIASPSGDPEKLRTVMAETTPADVGMTAANQDEVLSRFKISVFTEGSGTQIFSTTFAQWTAREALRRAQPSTLVVRFGPRQRQLPMDELLAGVNGNVPDPAGSLIDADMGSFYIWIDQQRLSGSAQAWFVAWSQEYNQAMAVGPGFPRKTFAATRVSLKEILS